MSEERAQYTTSTLLKPDIKPVTLDTQTHNEFVEVRTRRGKLIFRLDPNRMLVEWREAKDTELIDLTPYFR